MQPLTCSSLKREGPVGIVLYQAVTLGAGAVAAVSSALGLPTLAVVTISVAMAALGFLLVGRLGAVVSDHELIFRCALSPRIHHVPLIDIVSIRFQAPNWPVNGQLRVLSIETTQKESFIVSSISMPGDQIGRAHV